MVVPDGELEVVGRDARAVIDEAKAAGVYVFAGGIDEAVAPVLVSADGTFSAGGYSWAPPLDGGFTMLELPAREEAIAWAARRAALNVADSSWGGTGGLTHQCSGANWHSRLDCPCLPCSTSQGIRSAQARSRTVGRGCA